MTPTSWLNHGSWLQSSTSGSNSNNTPSSSNGNGADEIAKLIGKRSQIKRKKNEEPPPPPEPLADLDLEKLPQFRTERPVIRRTSKQNESIDDNEVSSTSSSGEASKAARAPIIDFMADYEDENDLVHIPNRIAVTTEDWGDPTRNFVASGKLSKKALAAGKFVPGDLQLAYQELLQGGILAIESSTSYGAASKSSELSANHILGRCLAEQPDSLPDSIIFQTWKGNPWFHLAKGRGRLSNALISDLEVGLQLLNDASLVEVFIAKKPWWFPSTSILANALAKAVESGQCNSVGVMGVTKPPTLRKLSKKLKDLDAKLSVAAFDFSLTDTRYVYMLDACKSLGIVPLCTNPLDRGLASGVFTASNPSGGVTGGASPFSFKQLEKLQPLHSVQETVVERVRTRLLREIRENQDRLAKKYGGSTPAINTDITTTQIALQYVIAKGGVPLVPVNSPKLAKEVLGCLGWTLNADEVKMLDQAAALCKI